MFRQVLTMTLRKHFLFKKKKMKTLNKAATATVCIKYSKKNLCHFNNFFVFMNGLEGLSHRFCDLLSFIVL